MIRRICFHTLALALVAGFALAQQPNSAGGSLQINATNGPPFPITGVDLPVGLPNTAVINGGANLPWVAYASSGLVTNGYSVLNGQLVDLHPTGFTEVYNGLQDPFFRTDATGSWAASFVIDPTTANIGQNLAIQAMVADIQSPVGVTLTAATLVTVANGIISNTLVLGDDTSQNISLQQYNLSFPFYGTSYTSFFVCANGFVSFNSTTTDFQPTPTAFLGQMPRIGMFWTDLSPNAGGTVSVDIDQTVSPNKIIVNFDQVAEFGGTGPNHTFRAELLAGVGDIDIVNTAFNPGPATFTVIQGITPGGNQSPTTGPMDLSALTVTAPLIGQNFEAMFEWFGNTGMVNWTLPTSNFFDMTLKTFRASAVGQSYFAYTL